MKNQNSLIELKLQEISMKRQEDIKNLLIVINYKKETMLASFPTKVQDLK